MTKIKPVSLEQFCDILGLHLFSKKGPDGWRIHIADIGGSYLLITNPFNTKLKAMNDACKQLSSMPSWSGVIIKINPNVALNRRGWVDRG